MKKIIKNHNKPYIVKGNKKMILFQIFKGEGHFIYII